jgi:hypothetical protein
MLGFGLPQQVDHYPGARSVLIGLAAVIGVVLYLDTYFS